MHSALDAWRELIYPKIMRHIIQFKIYKGKKYYVAEGVDLPVVTQGKTLDEVAANIEEAVALYLEGENLTELDLASEPSVLVNFELAASHV